MPERPAPPPGAAARAATPSGGGPDVFYDAWDDESELAQAPTGAEVEGGEAGPSGAITNHNKATMASALETGFVHGIQELVV